MNTERPDRKSGSLAWRAWGLNWLHPEQGVRSDKVKIRVIGILNILS